MPKSMIDQDFMEEDDDLLLPEGKEQEPSKDEVPVVGEPVDVEISVVDDTPEADRGRPNADTAVIEDDETEAEKYSKKVKNRFDKLTAATHAERRAKEDRERQLNEAAELARRLIQENNHLKGLIENGEKVLVTEHQGRLDGQLNAAKSAYREAHEAGDVNGMLAAQESMARVAAQLDRLSIHQAAPLQRMDEQREISRLTQAPQAQTPAAQPEAVAWQEKNKWFGRDEAMTSFAMGYHSQLVNREGIQPTDKEYWPRIDAEMRKRFPERFGSTTAPRRTETVVAPASRSASGKVTRKVTLTESQARVARRIGLTLEQYAEQIAAESSSSEKEWTHG